MRSEGAGWAVEVLTDENRHPTSEAVRVKAAIPNELSATGKLGTEKRRGWKDKILYRLPKTGRVSEVVKQSGDARRSQRLDSVITR
jgi:hypothetical protein